MPAGALVLLSTTTLAADGTFNISGIDQTYTDLVVACKLRGANASATGTVFLTVNSDGGANYQYVSFGAINASSALPGAAASSTNIGLSQINCNTAPAKSFTAFEFTIFNYASTTQNKTMLGQYNQNSSNVAAGIGVFQWSAEWAPATPVAITSLQISRAGSNCLAGSQVRIYGRS